METGLAAVIFLTFTMAVVLGCGAFLVYRVMNRPDSHIGSRLPREDPGAEAGPEHPRDPDAET